AEGYTMRIGLMCDNSMWRDRSEPFQAVAAGLARLGHTVQVVAPSDGKLWGAEPDVVFVWGVHGLKGRLAERFRAAGKTAMVMERGFFDRFNYTQIDHAGFSHTASWTSAATNWLKAPRGAKSRFRSVWRNRAAGFGARAGYLLVLLQTPGDAQLAGTEIHHPGPLVQAIEAAAPLGLDIRVRHHPLSPWRCGTTGRARMVDGDLRKAIAGAEFCVTINSNAGNEALAMGCPVLCLGPALYAMAGVARRSSLADLPRAIAEMDAGWRPENDAVRAYLAHLAHRQWTCEELADGRPLAEVLGDASAVGQLEECAAN
ncbi:hypothetical protein LCGC14_1589480, partial [marine sediment metagenome]